MSRASCSRRTCGSGCRPTTWRGCGRGVADMDLSAFYAAYRADGHGRAAYEPSLMVALVLFAFATRQRSSRAIDRHCRQDVAYRVISGNLVPDHATIARFICRHEHALADLFGDVLKLCEGAGLVKPGVVSIDGTRIAGNASPRSITASIRSPGRFWPRPRRPMRPRMSSTARSVVMSCLSSCAPLRVGGSSSARPSESVSARTRTAGRPSPSPRRRLSSTRRASSGGGGRDATRGCGRASASPSSTAGRTQTRSRAVGQAGCCWAPSDWNQTTTSGVVPTPPMSITGRPGATGWVGGRAAVLSGIGRRSCRPAR